MTDWRAAFRKHVLPRFRRPEGAGARLSPSPWGAAGLCRSTSPGPELHPRPESVGG